MAPVEVTYVSGSGLLLGAGARWLLLGSPSADDAVLDELWALLTGPAVEAAALVGLVDRALGADVALAYVDTATGAASSRGGATATASADGHTLTLGQTEAAGRPLRLIGGIVGAGSAVIRHVTRRPPISGTPAAGPQMGGRRVTSGGPLIDGIPPEILAATAPAPPSPPSLAPVTTAAPSAADLPLERTVRRASVDTDHDGRTMHRPEPTDPGNPGAHLRQATHETVLAAYCPVGHLTEAFTPTCRVCGGVVPPQEPQRLPRPRLGVLHLPDGETVPLDRGVVLGRLPAPAPGGSDWPHLVRLPDDATFVSRSHLSVELDGWLVVATDLGSRGGTTLRVPGRAPERIRAHEPYVWEPGQVLDLADSYEIVYEVTP